MRINTENVHCKGTLVAAPSFDLKKSHQLLILPLLSDFIRFHAASSKGMIDDGGLITADSANTFLEWFFLRFARVAGSQVEEKDRYTVYL